MTQGLAPPVEGLITLFSHPVDAKGGWVGVASAAVARLAAAAASASESFVHFILFSGCVCGRRLLSCPFQFLLRCVRACMCVRVYEVACVCLYVCVCMCVAHLSVCPP